MFLQPLILLARIFLARATGLIEASRLDAVRQESEPENCQNEASRCPLPWFQVAIH
jgi:hypothetical protein